MVGHFEGGKNESQEITRDERQNEPNAEVNIFKFSEGNEKVIPEDDQKEGTADKNDAEYDDEYYGSETVSYEELFPN